MNKIIILISALFLQSCLIGAGKNSKISENKINFFPQVSGINLQGKTLQMPAAFNSKLNVVIVAFKREQQKDVDSWLAYLPQLTNENISVYELPIIYELNMLKRAWVNNAMRFGVKGETSRSHTITVYTNREKFFEIMKMQEDKIYVLLIDDKGKILSRIEGVADDKKVLELRKFIDKNL